MLLRASFCMIALCLVLSSAHTPWAWSMPVIADTIPTRYQWHSLSVGQPVYLDRSYQFSDIPSPYRESSYLRTANNDKTLASARAVQFNIDRDSTVYVGYDARIPVLPAWLGTWTRTGDVISTSDTDLLLFKKDFSPGTVTLGGNAAFGWHSMYTVLIRARSSDGEETHDPGGLTSECPSPSPIEPESYIWGFMSLGKAVYVDRSYEFMEIPSQYHGLPYLRTANNDKSLSDARAVSFRLNKHAAVFVGYDERVRMLPSWLQGWRETGHRIRTSDTSFRLYQGSFSPGIVTLGANELGFSMYTVIVDCTSVDLPISTTQGTPYRWGRLAVGEPVYIDRNYSFTRIPSPLIGRNYVLTANDDKTVSDPETLTIHLPHPATILIGYDIRIGVLPRWLETWEKTGEVISTSDTTFNLYQRSFPAGPLLLGGNEMGFSMYMVILSSDELVTDDDLSISGNQPTTAQVAGTQGSVTLSWIRPTMNADGSPLTDLAGYHIYRGIEPGRYARVASIGNSGTTRYTIQGLGSGTHYFVTVAYNSLGATSDFSNEVSATLH